MNTKHIGYLIGLITILTVESALFALIATFFWKLSLMFKFNFPLSYFDWLGIILVIKLIRFNVLDIIMNPYIVPENGNSPNTVENEIH